MGNVVQIVVNDQEHNLGIKEYRKKRVITFKDIDNLHGRPDGTASRNFRENRERFIMKEDYFHLTQEQMRSTNFVERDNPQGLILITESGYLMLVKSFNDNLAWQVQRQLVNIYFRAKNTRYDLHNSPHSILKRNLATATTLGKGLPKPQQIALRRLAVIRAGEESGEDYSDILAILEPAIRFDAAQTTVNLQPLFDHLNANPNIGVEYDGHLWIRTTDFRKIISNLRMNYITVVRELDKLDMIVTHVDCNKRHFTRRCPKLVGARKDYYITLKQPEKAEPNSLMESDSHT